MPQRFYEHMKQQGSKRGTTDTSLRKIMLAQPESFQHFSISCQDLLNIFSDVSLSVCVYTFICA